MRRTARSSEARRSASGDSGARPGGRRGQRPPVAGPQRTCVACHAVRAKRELIRIVRSPAGDLTVDLRGKAAGRGAYCDPDAACLERGLHEGAIARALEVTIDERTAERLRAEMAGAAMTRQQQEQENR